MKKINIGIVLLTTMLFVSAQVFASGGGHEEKEGKEEAQAEGIEMSAAKRKEANITVEAIMLKNIAKTIHVPAEVKVNNYRAQVITPRISSMVIKRYVKLGDKIKPNQPLATLFSVDVSEAQGDFIVASKDWTRVKKLGKKVVSGKRYIETKVGYQQAKARLQAYGMVKNEINSLLIENNKHKPGHFTLFSEQAGIITSDDFRSGEIIEPGRTLFDVIDESTLWVEAQVSPKYSAMIKKHDLAFVHVNGLMREAVVIQKNHILDEKTRTLTIRLEIDNSEHLLAPGQFVNVEIASDAGHKVLAVPSASVLRSSDGDWQIFVESDEGKLSSLEIEVVRNAGNMKVITGIKEGTKVVTNGAFFVQSEIAKGGFNIHGH